jgi:hypothetical protein
VGDWSVSLTELSNDDIEWIDKLIATAAQPQTPVITVPESAQRI